MVGAATVLHDAAHGQPWPSGRRGWWRSTGEVSRPHWSSRETAPFSRSGAVNMLAIAIRALRNWGQSPPPAYRHASCLCRACRPANLGALPRVVPSSSESSLRPGSPHGGGADRPNALIPGSRGPYHWRSASPRRRDPTCGPPREPATSRLRRRESTSAKRVGRDATDLGDRVSGDARPLGRGDDRVGARRLVQAVGAVPVGAQEGEQPAHALVRC